MSDIGRKRECPLCKGSGKRPVRYVLRGEISISVHGQSIGKSTGPNTLTMPGPCEVCDGEGVVHD